MISSKAVTSLDIFHHKISKPIYMTWSSATRENEEIWSQQLDYQTLIKLVSKLGNERVKDYCEPLTDKTTPHVIIL